MARFEDYSVHASSLKPTTHLQVFPPSSTFEILPHSAPRLPGPTVLLFPRRVCLLFLQPSPKGLTPTILHLHGGRRFGLSCRNAWKTRQSRLQRRQKPRPRAGHWTLRYVHRSRNEAETLCRRTKCPSCIRCVTRLGSSAQQYCTCSTSA